MTKGSGSGQIVNRAGLADLVGVSLPTVDDWVRRGCPVVTRGRRGVSWEFNSADVMRWFAEDQVAKAIGEAPASEKEIRLRRLVAQTELDELTLARERGAVVALDEIERVITRAFAEIRSALLVIPSRAAPQVVGEIDEASIKAVLHREVRQALTALADSGLVSSADFDEGHGDDD